MTYKDKGSYESSQPCINEREKSERGNECVCVGMCVFVCVCGWVLRVECEQLHAVSVRRKSEREREREKNTQEKVRDEEESVRVRVRAHGRARDLWREDTFVHVGGMFVCMVVCLMCMMVYMCILV